MPEQNVFAGPIYSRLYLGSDELQDDCPRFRVRIIARFDQACDYQRQEDVQIADIVKAELGINVPRRYMAMGISRAGFDEYFAEAPLRDILDVVTIIYRFLARQVYPERAETWQSEIERALREQRLPYEIDADGVVHPHIDQEFSRSRQSTIGALSGDHFTAARERYEEACDHLGSDGREAGDAIDKIFKANESVFRQITGARSLDSDGCTHVLSAKFQAIYDGDQHATSAAALTCQGFSKWVAAAHNYRHEGGVDAPNPAPLDLAITMVSQGAGYLRWMALNFDALKADGRLGRS